ncbi:TPA: hypothetical protein N0F65_004229 [Lagenidium giganteum]|uniref:Uncharacterized protein n=1 Tax=Lagenidium giganteum TaxID=4803 RepID=A0AAV2Z9L6_9STRA|nr:TPA: hypothetical protein N0F65_004229 [Lagenidium giganteum]
MDGLFMAWQMTALASCIVAGGLMVFFFYKYARTRAHPGPVLLCIFLSGCIANIARVALHTLHSSKDTTDNANAATMSDIANTELHAYVPGVESYIPFFFWCEFFFLTSATMWYLMLALDLIFSLSNPFLPFNADNIKHHVFAWPAAMLWCVIFRYAFVRTNNKRSKHIMFYFHLPAYVSLIYITAALVIAWRKSRRLEAHAHLTTRRMAKLILPYLAVFATYTIITFILYQFEVSEGTETTIANAIDQLSLVLETLAIFVLFCRDAGVFKALRGNKAPPRTMSQCEALSDHDDKIDVSNKLRMDIMKYTSMGIMQSIKQSIETNQRNPDVTFEDYNNVESMSIVIHGEIESVVLSFRDCAPKVFHNIRQHFNIDPQFFLESFDTTKILHEHGSEGKSGNIFYFTANRQFMVKSVPKEEFDTLRAILPHYHRYLLSNPQSMLCRYFGCHSISLPVGKRRMYFVVMHNLFNEGPVHQRFDLKGNRDRRQAINTSQVESYIQLAKEQRIIKKLMMDIDFRKFSGGISLSSASASVLEGQLCDDIVFLASRGIIDYSILLGVRYLNNGERLPSIAAQSQGIYSHDLDKIYYIGIVDMLQRYNWRWTVQRWFLGLLLCKDTHDVSAVPPDLYGARLTDFVRSRLFDIQPSASTLGCGTVAAAAGEDCYTPPPLHLTSDAERDGLRIVLVEAKGYAWEGSFERSWDAIEEDESGKLKIDMNTTTKQRQRRLEIARNVRKGLIRYVYLVMDLSRGMTNKDWKPHRLSCVSGVLQQFVKDYFDQNPISQLGIIGVKGMKSEKLSDLSGNPKMHVEKIRDALAVDKEPSLQNALEIAKASLKTVPTYGSREIVVVYGNLVTADPGDIFTTIATLKREGIRVSFVGIGAEMHLLRKIADETQGTYHVAMDDSHLKHLMTAFTFPSPTIASAQSRFATLVEMGFPQRRSGALSLCMCHQAFTTVGYLCPRCKSKSCDLPTVCQVCNLPLVSSPHLARSYHHLFPVATFEKTVLKDNKRSPLKNQKCFACLLPFSMDSEGAAYECESCKNAFCSECDVYIHDSLHNCPGCC